MEFDIFICSLCHQLVSNTRSRSHPKRCRGRVNIPVTHPATTPQVSPPGVSLPSFEEVCELHRPTLRFIPSRARPAFARVLSASLRSVLSDNSVEAWLKLFMLPKCVLPSSKRRGRNLKPTSIEALCKLWSDKEFGLLWNLAKGNTSHFRGRQVSAEEPQRLIDSAISLAKAGMFGKACGILLSTGIAPNNDDTWKLLLSKHPSCPPPQVPQVPTVPISIGPDFNILGVLQSFPKGSAAGPSGLRIQHLLDAASIPLPTSICSSLKDVVNLLSSGKAPTSVSTFLAGGSLTALNKFKPGCLPDVRPIAVGEALRRLTGKCLCSLIKCKASEFFQPLQFGVACASGSEKVVHGLRACMDKHWEDDDFAVVKVDMRNAFNLVSRQAILDECAFHFPELLPWATWCYAAHPLLWHPMGRIFSETGVQQGDPLGPLLFALVLQKILNAIDADDDCIHILYQAWYLDDGTLAGKKSAILRALSLLDSIGPSFGIFINMSKCELFCKGDTSEFPPSMKSSHVPHLDLLGAPIGDYLFCGKYAASKRSEALKLLSRLVEVGASDPQVALILLRLCGSYCKLIHLARATPPSLVSEALQLFDVEVRQCFAQSIAVEVTDRAWQQAQLNLSHGGLGLRSVSHHSSAAYIASLCASGFGDAQNPHLSHTVDLFNKLVSPSEVISVDAITTSPVRQRVLSKKLEDHQFSLLLEASSPADKARLLSVSAPHAASWLLVTPSPGLDLHLDPNELQISIQWWLGIDTARGSSCSLCPGLVLDRLGNHATTCKRGGDVVTRHNHLRNVIVEFCHRAHLGVRVESGSGITPDLSRTRPADVLVLNWERGKHAALDITVTSPLIPSILTAASMSEGAAAEEAEVRKHRANDPKCSELGWVCIPLAVETYGNWGREAQSTFSRLASHLAIITSSHKGKVLTELYSRLNFTLVRAVARALLARCAPSLGLQDII
mgnify:FL=1